MVQVKKNFQKLLKQVSSDKRRSEDRFAGEDFDSDIGIKAGNFSFELIVFIGKVIEGVQTEKAPVGVIGIVVGIGKVGEIKPASAVGFQDADYFSLHSFKIFQMFQEALGVNLVDRIVGEKGEPLLHIGDDIYGGKVELIDSDSARRLGIAAPQLQN